MFETTDLYNKKNIPKVIYCVHALAHFLASKGLADNIDGLGGDLSFSEEQLRATKRGLDTAGVQMPNFDNIARDLGNEPKEPQLSEEELLYQELSQHSNGFTGMTANCLGLMERSRQYNSLLEARFTYAHFMAHVEGFRKRYTYQEQRNLYVDIVVWSIIILAHLRGMLVRWSFLQLKKGIRNRIAIYQKVQAHVYGTLARSRFDEIYSDLQSFDAFGDRNINLQAYARGGIQRRRLWEIYIELGKSMPGIIGLQETIRARQHRVTFLRRHTYLLRNIAKIVKAQSIVRGRQDRKAYEQLRLDMAFYQNQYMRSQARIRGVISRKAFMQRLTYFKDNLAKIVTIQSFVRARQQGQVYKQLTDGKNVAVGTIKKFGYLLEDTDLDLEQEIELQSARKLVVEKIKENAALEARATDLEIKIGLLVKNKVTLDEVIAATKRPDAKSHDPYVQVLFGKNEADNLHHNEYSLQGLDKDSQERLAGYQQLFYLLQTEPAYLARLFKEFNRGSTSGRIKKVLETVVMTMFCYAQNPREQYLLLKLIQRSIHEEMENVTRLSDMQSGNFMFIKLVLHYTRGSKERYYLRHSLGPIVGMIIKDQDLDLEIDPVEIYRALINAEETRSGKPTKKKMLVTAEEALQNKQVRTIFIRHLQQLRTIAEHILFEIFGSLKDLPYGLRYIAREIKRALVAKFPNEDPQRIHKIVGNLVYYRYINPALVAPEGFDIVQTVISPMQRKNLAEVSKLLNMINFGETFEVDEEKKQNLHYKDLNRYILRSSEKFSQWTAAVAEVGEPEDHLGNYKFADWTRTSRPSIYITPREIFWMHQVLADKIDVLAPPRRMDPMREILKELKEGPVVPEDLPTNNGSHICLTLTNRAELFARTDASSEIDALVAETKHLVLSVIKVQTGKSLYDILIQPVSNREEIMWQAVLLQGNTLRHERSRSKRSREAQNKELGIGILDVSTITFGELKAKTLENVLRLEKAKRITRKDNYQGLLNQIAIDIRDKNRKGVARSKELENLRNTLNRLRFKREYLDDQIATFNEYIESSMANLQNHKKDKKKFILPFTRQYFHQRDLQKQGKVPQFGSYKYTAQQLYERGILCSVDGHTTAAYRGITVTISCDQIGIFTAHADILGMMDVADETITLEALLDMQFRNTQTVKMFDGMVLLNVNLLLFLITKKFYR